MEHIPYSYIRLHPERYIFVSEGRRRIVKAVEFIQLEINNAMNIIFGDLLPDDTIDYESASNNGCLEWIILVLAGNL